MNILVRRFNDDRKSTASYIYVNGIHFCMGLEDTFRHEKVSGETRIPAGQYEIQMRHGSPVSKRYSKKFGTEGMPWLQSVPGFKYVYFHIGNTEDDTNGCILIGHNYAMSKRGTEFEQSIHDSTGCYIRFHELIVKALANGETVSCTVVD